MATSTATAHLHAHIKETSADCDGRYERTWVDHMISEELNDPFGDLAFRSRVVGSVITLFGWGDLQVREYGITWNEQTEEGYREVIVEWCDRDGCADRSTRRDFSAEAMGY